MAAAAEKVEKPHQAPAQAQAEPEQSTVDDLVGRELSQADRMYADGGQLFVGPDAARAALDGQFAPLANDADEADRQALQEGQRAAAELLVELAVPQDAAREISNTLAEWHGREEPSEDEKFAAQDAALAVLAKRWGKDTDAMIALAKRTAAEAAKRAPWLDELLVKGAGNSPELVAHFAAIGLRNARRARRGK